MVLSQNFQMFLNCPRVFRSNCSHVLVQNIFIVMFFSYNQGCGYHNWSLFTYDPKKLQESTESGFGIDSNTCSQGLKCCLLASLSNHFFKLSCEEERASQDNSLCKHTLHCMTNSLTLSFAELLDWNCSFNTLIWFNKPHEQRLVQFG